MNRVRAVLTALVVVLLALPALATASRDGSAPAQANGGKTASPNYIVQLADPPVVAYEGGINGLKATAPSKGSKINPNDPDVVRYVAHLDSKHAEVLQKVGGAAKLYDYRYAYNGFAAKLTPAQVAQLQKLDEVVSVENEHIAHPDTATTPDFLGLTAPGGLYSQQDAKNNAIKGEDVVIGIVDTGVWPEHPSFSDRDASGKLIYQPNPANWHGRSCHPGEQWTAAMCNQKLVGAQFFAEGAGITGDAGADFLSPRDFDGHGTHTATTAGGNAGVAATGPAAVFGTINGIAPRARIAAYKACWEGGCFSSDTTAAIDTAVRDGVDVINYSISGTLTQYLDSVEVSFLFASRAGVFVAASAGNSGPGASTVAHISPWLTTVAAGTHPRAGIGSTTLGNGVAYNGASLATAVASKPLILSSAAGLAGKNPTEVALCFLGTLDPAKVAGKIVVCDRGVNARVDKSHEVADKGGAGMILVNVSASSLNADFHFVPTVHVDHVDGAAIKTYAAAAGATASIAQATVTNSAPAPFVASFSSRGPSIAGGGDLLKPDVIAPGVDILAGVSPASGAGRMYDLLSGTSMSSPHVAGLAALMRQKYRSWSPAAIKSALMTSAGDLASGTSPFNQGAGHVRPNLAANPGLVYDADFNDYRNFLAGQALCRFCFGTQLASPIDPSDLNLASIAIGDLAGVQTVTRRVTNVGPAGTYTANVVAPAGVNVSVDPTSLQLATGETKSYTVTFTSAPTANFNSYAFGSLTWSDGTRNVRSPLVIRPVKLAAPASISGTGTSGSVERPIRFGYTGAFATRPQGLIPAATETRTVVDDPTNNFNETNPDANQGFQKHEITIPAGTVYQRFSLFNTATNGSHDLDLFVYNPAGVQVGRSAGGTTDEEVNLTNPAPGVYKVYVHGWEAVGGSAQYTLFNWSLSNTPVSPANMTITAPASATLGQAGTLRVAWSGLTGGTKYLGRVVYNDGAADIGSTVVRIDG